MAEFASDAKKRENAEQATQYYQQGLSEAAALPSTHPTRLGLALNYSVFLHEVVNERAQAIETAQRVYTEGLNELDSITDQSTKQEAELTLQLLRDNLFLWQGQ